MHDAVFDLTTCQTGYGGLDWAIFVARVCRAIHQPPVEWATVLSLFKHNDVVSFFFAALGVFYGLAMGLIAVATWENYTEIDGVVSTEAAAGRQPLPRP